jgi:subtilisin family serine protease
MGKKTRVLSWCIVISVLIILAVFLAAPSRPGRIHPALEQRLQTLAPGGKVGVIIELNEQADPSKVVAKMPKASKKQKARAVVDALKAMAEKTQGPLREHLQKQRFAGAAERILPFWVFNGVAVTATEQQIRELQDRPEVREIRLDVQIPLPSLSSARNTPPSAVAEWNIDQIRAPEVWAMNPAYNGAGTVIGSFDTGVDLTHPDLQSRYRGDHQISWFDPYNEHGVPYDANGHGTHTTGIAVGGDSAGSAIGVAPGAAWIAAKGWDDAGTGTVSSFHQIFEWFLAPGGNPDNAPDVVNSSWSFTEAGCIAEFEHDIEAWRAAGIFPTFAAGNSGPDPGSVNSPAASAVAFAVGSTDSSDSISDFSSQGPSPCDGSVKPDLAAPGDAVLSSVPWGYEVLSGTSMAAPHVTGAAAVLRSIAPGLTVEEIETALTAGALDIGDPGPDNLSGAGRLDLYVSAQVALHGPGFPVVKVVATDKIATEAGPTSGTFTFTRSGNTGADLEVKYTVGGTATSGSDYEAIAENVTIPSGSESATVTVTAIDDPLQEVDETVSLTIEPDSAYIVSANGGATVTIESDELISDLVISSFSAPTKAAAGQTISLTDTTKNQGKGAAEPTLTRFYLSSNAIYETFDLLLGSREVPALAAGASHSGSTTVTIPAGTLGGSWSVIARADGEETQFESSETNNISVRTILIGPDLDITAMSAPAVAGAGKSISVTDTTKNLGADAAGASQTRFYFSINAAFETSDTLIGSRSVPVLAAGASSSGSTNVTIPQGTPVGTYYIVGLADGEGVVSETSESNNIYARSIMIGPDLKIASLTAPAAAAAGQTISVSDASKNAGGDEAGASVTQIFLSANGTLDATDVLMGSRSVPALAAGASSAGSTSVKIPDELTAGVWYIVAKADGQGAVTEISESNNVSSRSIKIGADLTVTSLVSSPAGAAPGQTISTTDTTKNAGAAAIGPSLTYIYFSANGSIDAGESPVGSRAVPGLAAGASHSGSLSFTIPADTAPRTWYIIAKADGEGTLAETSETNNTYTRSIKVGPDLDVTALSAPATAAAGQSITVTDTTKNVGGSEAGPSTTQFFLSRNSSLDASDILVGSRGLSALGAGSSSSGSVTVTIPQGTDAGTWYIICRADGEGTVTEISETNNIYARSITIN